MLSLTNGIWSLHCSGGNLVEELTLQLLVNSRNVLIGNLGKTLAVVLGLATMNFAVILISSH